jgi:UDP-glucose 4-epimerase
MKVVISGAAGRLGRLISERLAAANHEVFGIDHRPWPEPPVGVTMFQADLRKRSAEDVFRSQRPDALIHFATVSHLQRHEARSARLSLAATKAVVDYCDRYGVKQALFVGRHSYYGASPDAPLYHTEDDPPLASEEFPELADLVAADLFAGSTLWRYPKIETAILRLCYTLGASGHGTLGDFLRGPKVPTILGFDPLFQFMHEADAARAIEAALLRQLRGVFNVAGPGPLPLSTIISETGREILPIPEPLFRFMNGKFGLPKLPRGVVAHLKHPIVVDASAFRQRAQFQHEFDEYDAMAAFRSSVPASSLDEPASENSLP